MNAVFHVKARDLKHICCLLKYQRPKLSIIRAKTGIILGTPAWECYLVQNLWLEICTSFTWIKKIEKKKRKERVTRDSEKNGILNHISKICLIKPPWTVVKATRKITGNNRCWEIKSRKGPLFKQNKWNHWYSSCFQRDCFQTPDLFPYFILCSWWWMSWGKVEAHYYAAAHVQ